ncbi:MAG: AMP-binding protein [Pseudomonadota bacterium]|nr:AMP-binding protein [Pseudomonadota bacterium]
MDNLLKRLEQRATLAPRSASLRGATASGKLVALDARQLHDSVTALAQQLAQTGVRHIGIAGHNSPSWLVAQLAAWRAGLPVTPIPSFFSDDQVTHLLSTTGLDGILITDGSSLDRWVDARLLPVFDRGLLPEQQPPHVIGVEPNVALFQRASVPAPMPAETRLITFTSGTTGTPKGVCLSGPHLESVLLGLDDRLQGIELTRHGVVLPLAVLLEHLAGALYALWRGAEVIIDPPQVTGLEGSGNLSSPHWQRWLAGRQPDSLILVPALLAALCQIARQEGDAPWMTSLNLVAVGGDHVPPVLLADAKALKLPVAQGYGMSEMGSVVCLSRPDEPQDGRVGRPLKGRDITTDPSGQLLVHGPRMLGYLGEATDTGPGPMDVPWPSGDLGEQRHGGHWYLSGRQRNVIILSTGRNLSPEWIEAELATLAGIDRAFVFGDGLPGLLALISLSSCQVDTTAIDSAIASLNQRLPDYARIRGWAALTAALPGLPTPLSEASHELTSNGRLRRDGVRLRRHRDMQRLAEQTFCEAPPPEQTPCDPLHSMPGDSADSVTNSLVEPLYRFSPQRVTRQPGRPSDE